MQSNQSPCSSAPCTPNLTTPTPTSPQPSYGDLLAHWQLKAALRGDAQPYDASQLSDVVEACGATTQALMKLEREAESYWVAEYFRQAARWDVRFQWWGGLWVLQLAAVLGAWRSLACCARARA